MYSEDEVREILCALYLRGMSARQPAPRKGWRTVDSALRRMPEKRPSERLRRAGLWAEATMLEFPDLLPRAKEVISMNGVLISGDAGYPSNWVLRLGNQAPPAVWKRGALPHGNLVAIVGSRAVDQDAIAFAREVAQEAIRLGYDVISGGAVGCDRAAASGSRGHCLNVFPFGLPFGGRRSGITVCGPNEPFSVGNAMERNTLIYAAAERAVVVHTRFMEGGTWTGVREALRRRLCPIAVRSDGSRASAALVALGADPLESPSDLAKLMESSPRLVQPELGLMLR